MPNRGEQFGRDLCYDPTNFPTLMQARSLVGVGGSCFHQATALLLDFPSGMLCVGTLEGDGDPFIHAWIERGEALYAPTTIDAAGGILAVIDRAYYYLTNGVRDVHRMNRAGLKGLAVRHGWLRVRPFGNGDMLSEPLGTTLLRALGVPYRIDPTTGGVVPV